MLGHGWLNLTQPSSRGLKMNRELVDKVTDLRGQLGLAEMKLTWAKEGVSIQLTRPYAGHTGQHLHCEEESVTRQVQALVVEHYTKEVQNLSQQLADL